ncbi:MAG: NAD-binding protein [Promethearchaeota archaeon]
MYKLKRMRIKLEIVLAQNKLMVGIIFTWFIVNYILLFISTNDVSNALLILFYIRELDTPYGRFYATYSDFIVFGLLIGLITVDAFRHYKPLNTCEKLASRLKDHVIITGYNHLVERFDDFLNLRKIPHVIIVKDDNDVEDLIEKELPIVIFDDLDDEFMKKIAIESAKSIFLLENDIIFNVELATLARKSNENIQIIVRNFRDELDELFKNLNCQLISSSRATADKLLKREMAQRELKNICIIGFNHFSEQLASQALNHSIKSVIIVDDDEQLDDASDFYISLKSAEKKFVKIQDQNPIEVFKQQFPEISQAELIIISLEADEDAINLANIAQDTNEKARVIVRTFSDVLEKVLNNMNMKTVSTSKFALEEFLKPFFD